MTTNKPKCLFCGGEAVSIHNTIIDDKHYTFALCVAEGAAVDHCGGCSNIEGCLAQINLDNIPKTIVQKQGNMTMQIPNPELTKHYCNIDKCKCADTEGNCARNVDYCNNWELHSKIKQKIVEAYA